MTELYNTLTVLVATAHFGFLALEMFLWTKPYGMKTFRLTAEFAQASRPLAANQGLYNGFLAAGLLVGMVSQDGDLLRVFCLICVVVAGVFGALTVSKRILFLQALPAALALAVRAAI